MDTQRCINEKLVEVHDGSTKAGQSNESNEETTTEQPHDELLNSEISENHEPTSMNQALSTSQLSQATEVTGTVNQSNLINTESLTPVLPQTRSKLPKLILPKFRGEITQWRPFWDSFNSAVHTNSYLSNIDKFNHLNSVLEGQASRAIQGLTLSESNYQAAVELLHQRFGNPQHIISTHMDELLKIPACTGEKASQLRFLYDKISINVRGLEALGVNSSQYGSLLIPVVMSKLPQDVRIQIARNTSQGVWEMSPLLDVIRKEVEEREISESVRVCTEKPKGQNPRL